MLSTVARPSTVSLLNLKRVLARPLELFFGDALFVVDDFVLVMGIMLVEVQQSVALRSELNRNILGAGVI